MGTNLPFIAGGGRFSSNEVLLDGIDNNTTVTSGAIGRNGIALQPSVDAVQEFKVKTNSFSAEFGHAAGAVISATIKGGSNGYHGTLFEFLRNDKLDANNFFTNAAGLPRAAFRQNQFGGVFGGRIIRNKTFFFVDYQGTRQRTAAASSVGSVPPAAIRNGDLSSLRTPIFDPFARRLAANGNVVSTLFPNAVIPASLINPSSTAAERFGCQFRRARRYVAQLLPAVAARLRSDQWDARGPRCLEQRTISSARFKSNSTTSTRPIRWFHRRRNQLYRDIFQGRAERTHVFTPTVVNEFRAGYTRHNGSRLVDGVDEREVRGGQPIALFPFPVKGFPRSLSIFPAKAQAPRSSMASAADQQFELREPIPLRRFGFANRGKHAMKIGGACVATASTICAAIPSSAFIFGSIFSSSTDTPGSACPLPT
jgi:hypothetical protein